MPDKLFDSSILATPQDSLDFITNVLQASTEYSIIGKGMDGTIVLWNEGARRLYGYEPDEVVGKANADILHTPRKDGFDFIQEVKNDSELRKIPFVFISSTVWRERERTLGLSLGAAQFIIRPIEPQALIAQIEACRRKAEGA